MWYMCDDLKLKGLRLNNMKKFEGLGYAIIDDVYDNGYHDKNQGSTCQICRIYYMS